MASKTHRRSGPRVRDVPQELLDRGRTMAGVGRDIWLAGLGVVAVAGEEGSHLFDRLVERGEALEQRGKEEIAEGREELSAALDRLTRELDALAARGKEEIVEGREDLSATLERLTRQLDALAGRGTNGDGAGPVKVYRVFPGDDGWAVGRGKARSVSVYATKSLALDQARKLARDDPPSRLEVFRKDGTLQDAFQF